MCLKYLHDVIILCALLNAPIRYIVAFQTSTWNVLKRSAEIEAEYADPESKFLDCKQQELRSRPGTFTFISAGSKESCSLYIAAPIDNTIEVEFEYIDPVCENGGDIAILDGWELDHQIFPSIEDHPDPMSTRYISFCHGSTPDAQYISKQNIVQIQYMAPIEGQGFRVKVNFKVNYTPCNMMLLTNHYEKITLRNYGLRRNCTVLSLYPQRAQFLYVNIGETDRDALFSQSSTESSTGLRTSCNSPSGGEDSVQLYDGTGVGSESLRLVLSVCGLRQTTAPRTFRLGCASSAVRLQSSGNYFNAVKFAFLPNDEGNGKIC